VLVGVGSIDGIRDRMWEINEELFKKSFNVIHLCSQTTKHCPPNPIQNNCLECISACYLGIFVTWISWYIPQR
jgi:hypothetical protein